MLSGLQSPVAFVQDPTDRDVQFVVEQRGRIRVVRNAAIVGTDFLNLTGAVSCCGERGLLGLAFAPDYASSGRFYVNFTNVDGRHGGRAIHALFQRPGGSLVAIRPAVGRDAAFRAAAVLESQWRTPRVRPGRVSLHRAWRRRSGNDPDHRAQNPNELLGKMLRIDVNVPVSNTLGYTIPPNNPFRGTNPARDEIWAFGLRNPWRYSFDDVTRGGTGALVIGDVGQNRLEEIDYEPRGAGGRNYGWRNFEGTRANDTSRPLAYEPATGPIFEYGRGDGVSVTGGFVYRGTRLGAGISRAILLRGLLGPRLVARAYPRWSR